MTAMVWVRIWTTTLYSCDVWFSEHTGQLRVRLSFYMVHMVSLDSKRSGENEEESETC